jgi:hypothetical protein
MAYDVVVLIMHSWHHVKCLDGGHMPATTCGGACHCRVFTSPGSCNPHSIRHIARDHSPPASCRHVVGTHYPPGQPQAAAWTLYIVHSGTDMQTCTLCQNPELTLSTLRKSLWEGSLQAGPQAQRFPQMGAVQPSMAGLEGQQYWLSLSATQGPHATIPRGPAIDIGAVSTPPLL